MMGSGGAAIGRSGDFLRSMTGAGPVIAIPVDVGRRDEPGPRGAAYLTAAR